MDNEVVSSWIDLTHQAASVFDRKSSVPKFWNKRTRPDGRLLGEARRTAVQQGVLTKHAAGSALVRIGPTHVLAAVTLQVGQPVTKEDMGDIMVTMDNNAIVQTELQRLLEETMDLHQLSIVPGKAAFRLCITVEAIEDAGNVRDAAILACVAALKNTRLPTQTIWKDGVVWLKPIATDEANGDRSTSKALEMPIVPIPLTLGVWMEAKDDGPESDDENGSNPIETSNQIVWVVDPDHDEESVLATILTVVVNMENMEELISVKLSGDVSVGFSDLAFATKLGIGRAADLIKIFDSP